MSNTALARPGVIDKTVPAWWAQIEDDPDEAALDDDDIEDEDDDLDADELEELEFGDDDDDWDDDDSEEDLDALVAADQDKENESWYGSPGRLPSDSRIIPDGASPGAVPPLSLWCGTGHPRG